MVVGLTAGRAFHTMEFPPITFDSEGKLRVLDPEKFTATEELEKEARAFVSSECGASGLVAHARASGPLVVSALRCAAADAATVATYTSVSLELLAWCRLAGKSV